MIVYLRWRIAFASSIRNGKLRPRSWTQFAYGIRLLFGSEKNILLIRRQPSWTAHRILMNIEPSSKVVFSPMQMRFLTTVQRSAMRFDWPPEHEGGLRRVEDSHCRWKCRRMWYAWALIPRQILRNTAKRGQGSRFCVNHFDSTTVCRRLL